eukprot:Nk52_evm70s1810 gene=Nk52_evmTU70s1810
MDPNLSAAFEKHLLDAAKMVEQQVDSELNKLDNLEEDDLEAIRRKRLDQLKKMAKRKEEWRANGHGKYTLIDGEKEFFNVSKNSDNIVCHFFRNTTWRCKILDRHLSELAEKHMECRFIKIDAEKSPFLTERLKITIMPTLVLVKKGKVMGQMPGFDMFGGVDNFKTEQLAQALGDLINYDGNIYCDGVAPEDDCESDESYS